MARKTAKKATRKRKQNAVLQVEDKKLLDVRSFKQGTTHYNYLDGYRVIILSKGQEENTFNCSVHYDVPSPLVPGSYHIKPSEEKVFYLGFLENRTKSIEPESAKKIAGLEAQVTQLLSEVNIAVAKSHILNDYENLKKVALEKHAAYRSCFASAMPEHLNTERKPKKNKKEYDIIF